MSAIETLMEEHRIIESGLDALERFAQAAGSGPVAEEAATLADFVTFIREFADAHHHGKEEDLLFVAMVDAGFPREGGPIAVMLHEHDLGRAYVGRLDAVASNDAAWDAADRGEVLEAALGFVALLRGHIHKEDNVLYMMARQHLDADAMASLDEQSAAFEKRARDSGALERMHALAASLGERV
jgi:hemerythrin-like domain-containing protein